MDNFEVKKDFSYKECEMLMKISFVKNRQLLSTLDLARESSINYFNPYFYRLLNYLIEINIIEIVKAEKKS